MTAVTFPLHPPSLAFSICGRRWQNDVYEIKYSVWRWLTRRCQEELGRLCHSLSLRKQGGILSPRLETPLEPLPRCRFADLFPLLYHKLMNGVFVYSEHMSHDCGIEVRGVWIPFSQNTAFCSAKSVSGRLAMWFYRIPKTCVSRNRNKRTLAVPDLSLASEKVWHEEDVRAEMYWTISRDWISFHSSNKACSRSPNPQSCHPILLLTSSALIPGNLSRTPRTIDKQSDSLLSVSRDCTLFFKVWQNWWIFLGWDLWTVGRALMLSTYALTISLVFP